MRKVLSTLDANWQALGYGTDVGQDMASGRRLTHVAFVDDVTLIASSWPSLKHMMMDLRARLCAFGLELHPT
eukprot:1806795-Karenia_brevis.AAC.1